MMEEWVLYTNVVVFAYESLFTPGSIVIPTVLLIASCWSHHTGVNVETYHF